MQQAALVIGGPGAGKTTRALALMRQVLATDISDPFQIGFVSFTRAARREASTRAGEAFQIAPERLEHEGWFRTIHSVCHRILRVQAGQLLSSDATSRAWLRNVWQAEDDFVPADLEADTPETGQPVTVPGKVLNLWDLARNRLVPFRTVWEEGWKVDKQLPSNFEDAWKLVAHYEQCKRRDGKLDFTDLLLRVAGMQCDGGWPQAGEPLPDSALPDCDVWFIDEAQDNSRLMDWVCARITKKARWVYVFGDPLQAIYGWSGGDHRAFMSWDYVHKQILPLSHRCPAAILEPARKIARRTSDWFDHDFAPREGAGRLDQRQNIASLIEVINPAEDTLVLARTNHLAGQLATLIDEAALPWQPTRGRGGFNAPRRVGAAITALDLRAGKPITVDQWGLLLGQLAPVVEGRRLLVHGVKTRFADPDYRETLPATATLAQLEVYGATAEFCEVLQREDWCQWFQDPPRFRTIAQAARHGEALLREPKIRVGTIHSAKGAEAAHVVLWNATSGFVNAQLKDNPARQDEERRVWYVAHTRAKERMTSIVGDSPYRFSLYLKDGK